MRDIGKCRGQSKETGDWLKGWYLEYDGKSYLFQEQEGGFLVGLIEVIPETVGESIRRKDKNGVEIYEGDKWRLSGKTFIVTYGESRPYELGEVVG